MYHFGIDLGTTNSCIAVHSGSADGKGTKVIPLRNGNVTLPSCVMYKDGRVIVGKEAFKHRWDIDHVVYSVKRIMGTNKPIELLDDATGKKFTVSPVDVSAEILKELKRNAEVLYGEIKDIVITVPAYFGMEQRRDTKKAAEKAGFNVLSLISEPTSAALAYGLNTDEESDQILVYDLGGGTFDVSLLKFSKLQDTSFELLGLDFGDASDDMICKVISTSGDNHLGGDDLDKAVADIIMERFRKHCETEFGQVPEEYITQELKERIILAVESCKRSGADKIYQHIFTPNINGETKQVIISWGESDFRTAFRPLFERTMACIQQCLITASDNYFSKIVLVGGSTKLPMLKQMLRESFKDVDILDTLNPDESVAIGAAIKAAADAGDSGTLVDDVLPMPIGIEAINVYGDAAIAGSFTQIIPKNAILPVEASKSFVTNEDDQDKIEVRVYQGTSPRVVNNTLLGTLTFDKIPKGPAGQVEVIVKFLVDANGLLSVKVKTSEGETEAKLSNILNPVAINNSMIGKKIKRHLSMLESLQVPATTKLRAESMLEKCLEEDVLTEDANKVMAVIAEQYRKLTAVARQEVFARFNQNMGGIDSDGSDDFEDDDDLE